jgi:transposase
VIFAGFSLGPESAILHSMRDNDWTRVLGWPGYKVYRHEIDEQAKRLKLWVRRKRANKLLVCSGCGKPTSEMVASYEREVRDLPCFEYLTTVVIELYRVRCPDCGVKAEKVPLLPGKAPFSKRFEDAVGQACESSAASRVARQFGLAASTVRAIDQRYLARWAQSRRRPALRQMGVDEIFLGKKQKFITVVSNLVTAEPLWFGAERKKETLDEIFSKQLSAFQRSTVRAACVDMWQPFKQSIEQWLPNCRIIYDKFHIMKHAGAAVDEVRRQEFFRKGGPARELVKGKRWLLLTRWVHLTVRKKQQLNELFALNRRVMKAYLLKESLDRLWSYRYEGSMLRYLNCWIDQLRWQRLKSMERLADMLLRHLEGILNYCRTKVPLGVVEAVNGNIKALLRRGRGYRNLNYLLLKAQRLAATRTQLVALQKAA